MSAPEFVPYAPTFAEYVKRAEGRSRAMTEERRGQAFFNELHTMRPDIANALRSGPFDPFQSDALVPAFLAEVARLWDAS